MTKKPLTTTSLLPAAVVLASRLQRGLRNDPDFSLDDVPILTNGDDEPGAMFHVTDAEGRRWRVRVIAQS